MVLSIALAKQELWLVLFSRRLIQVDPPHIVSHASESRLIAPFAVTGGVLAFFGALLLCFSVEICVRLRKNAKRVKDPEIDKLKNLHHIKHWMPPGELWKGTDAVARTLHPFPRE